MRAAPQREQRAINPSKDNRIPLLYILLTNSLDSTLSCTVILPYSKVNPLLFEAFLTPSIHTLFGLPMLLLAFTSYTLFQILSLFIRSTCPNHHSQVDRSTCASFLLPISSFLILSLTVTPHILLKHLFSITFNLLFSLAFNPHVSAHTVGTNDSA